MNWFSSVESDHLKLLWIRLWNWNQEEFVLERLCTPGTSDCNVLLGFWSSFIILDLNQCLETFWCWKGVQRFDDKSNYVINWIILFVHYRCDKLNLKIKYFLHHLSDILNALELATFNAWWTILMRNLSDPREHLLLPACFLLNTLAFSRFQFLLITLCLKYLIWINFLNPKVT